MANPSWMIDLSGRVFERLTVLAEAPRLARAKRKWTCRCSCGELRIVDQDKLTRGTTLSCGCLGGERRGESVRTHGCSHTAEHKAYRAIKRRCTNPVERSYKNYGARGISMCQGWTDSFDLFLSDMGPRPPGMSIDRIDVNGGYWCGRCNECASTSRPSNCRWADKYQQARNTTRSVLTADDVKTIREMHRLVRSPDAISKALGLCNATVSGIVYGQKWPVGTV